MKISNRRRLEMLTASICRNMGYSVMNSRVPRCLYGRPNPIESKKMLKEALETEREHFMRRWGVDPYAEENKENGPIVVQVDGSSRKRLVPGAKQTIINDFWRNKKTCDMCKRPDGLSKTATSEVLLIQRQTPMRKVSTQALVQTRHRQQQQQIQQQLQQETQQQQQLQEPKPDIAND